MARSALQRESVLAGSPRWRGQSGRVEVWYGTFSDRASGCGLWLHHELVAPTQGDPYLHGWASLFPPDRPPSTHRFGPEPVASHSCWFASRDTVVDPPRLSGSIGPIEWDLALHEASLPLWTFPRWAWEREILPAAQVVVAPSALVHGAVVARDSQFAFDGRGGLAHIYGHGNAERWGWLHADLGGGDVLEVVSAVSRRPGLNRLPPMAFLRFRIDDRDWPDGAGLPAARVRTRLGLPRWGLHGRIGRHRVRVDVDQPEDRSAALTYVDPDGAEVTCTNSEQADAEIVLERRAGRSWALERSWTLHGTAHAEVGLRD